MSAAQVTAYANGTDTSLATTSAKVSVSTVANSAIHFWMTWDNSVTSTISTIVSTPTATWNVLDTVLDVTDNQQSMHAYADGLVATTYAITATLNLIATHVGCAAKAIGSTSGYTGGHSGNSQNAPSTGGNLTTSGSTSALSVTSSILSGFCGQLSGASTPSTGTNFINDGSGIQIGTGVNLLRAESLHISTNAASAANFTATVNSPHVSYVADFGDTGGVVSGPIYMYNNFQTLGVM